MGFTKGEQRILNGGSGESTQKAMELFVALGENVSKSGDHVVWADFSAPSFANPVIGARANREGGPGALAAAILGKTANHGLCSKENRRSIVVTEADEDALSERSLLGRTADFVSGGETSYYGGIIFGLEEAKIMASAVAAAGAVAMFHADDVTLEYADFDISNLEMIPIGKMGVEDANEKIDITDDMRLIVLGCPRSTEREIHEIAMPLAEGGKLISEGRSILKGKVCGKVLNLELPLGFPEGVDAFTGDLRVEREGNMSGRVLVFPRGKGRTGGSSVTYDLKVHGKVPTAVINSSAETIVATGVVMSSIPLVDSIEVSLIREGDDVTVDVDAGSVTMDNVRMIWSVSPIMLIGGKTMMFGRPDIARSFPHRWALCAGKIEAFDDIGTITFRVDDSATGWTIEHESLDGRKDPSEGISPTLYVLGVMAVVFVAIGIAAVRMKKGHRR